MACAPCAARAAAAAAFTGTPQIQGRVPNPNCPFTKELLNTWKSILNCIKQTRKYEEAGLSKIAFNQLAGIVQSAINYPEDYCYYEEQLEHFQTNLLPTIVVNVPECIS